MGRYISLAIGALILAAVLVALQMRKQGETGARLQDETPEQRSGSVVNPAMAESESSNARVASGETDQNPEPPLRREDADPQLRRWLTAEAKSLDAPSVNAEKKRKEIKEIVQKLTPAQPRQLLATARDPRAPAGEKILSTYLLVEGGPLSQSELAALITSPVEDHGPHQPHSEAEMAGVREKSLRIMALDGLFSRAQNDPSAREALAKVISDIQDPYVKEYARERYSRLSSH